MYAGTVRTGSTKVGRPWSQHVCLWGNIRVPWAPAGEPVLPCGQTPGVHHRTETQRCMASWALGTSREGSKHGTAPERQHTRGSTHLWQATAPRRHRQEDGPNPHLQHPHAQRQERPTTSSTPGQQTAQTKQSTRAGNKSRPGLPSHTEQGSTTRQPTTANTPPATVIPLAGAGRLVFGVGGQETNVYAVRPAGMDIFVLVTFLGVDVCILQNQPALGCNIGRCELPLALSPHTGEVGMGPRALGGWGWCGLGQQGAAPSPPRVC